MLSSTGQVKAGWPKPVNAGQQPFALTTYPVIGDLDGDGDLEIVMGAQDGRIHAFHHTGATVTGWPRSGATTVANSPTLGDIDGLNGLDVIGGYQGTNPKTLFAWRRDGTVLSGWPVSRPVFATGLGFNASAIADIDGDGRADVISSGDLTADPLRTLHAFRFDGTSVAGFPKLTAYSSPWPSNTPAVANLESRHRGHLPPDDRQSHRRKLREFRASRTFRVNNALVTCNGGNITLPATRNGGYCFQASAGDFAWAFFSTW